MQQVRAEKPKWYLSVIAGAVLRTLGHVAVRSAEYLGYLQKGQLPPARISLTAFTEEVVLDGASKTGPQPTTLLALPPEPLCRGSHCGLLQYARVCEQYRTHRSDYCSRVMRTPMLHLKRP